MKKEWIKLKLYDPITKKINENGYININTIICINNTEEYITIHFSSGLTLYTIDYSAKGLMQLISGINESINKTK